MTTETADWVGLTLDGRYTVTAKLGEGGMGFVYRANDARLTCDVVVKVPRAAMLEDAGFRKRFQDEVGALVRLAHPHVVKVSDFGLHDGIPFAVMQFLPGGSLEDRRPKDAAGNFKAVASRSLNEWLLPVAEALDFIHTQGFVHRDVKPANILFDAYKNAYISDFGVAKAVAGTKAAGPGVTGAGMVLGTPTYMAPELVLGKPFDGKIDQYALAVTAFELLAGQPPFDGPTPMAVLIMRTTEDPPALTAIRPGAAPALSAAVAKALSKDPAQRFPTCAAFAKAVLAAVGQAGPTIPVARAAGSEKQGPGSPKRETPRGGVKPTTAEAYGVVGPTGRPPWQRSAARAVDLPVAAVVEDVKLAFPTKTKSPKPAPSSGGRASLLVGVAIGVVLAGLVGGFIWSVGRGGGDTASREHPPAGPEPTIVDAKPPSPPAPIAKDQGARTARPSRGKGQEAATRGKANQGNAANAPPSGAIPAAAKQLDFRVTLAGPGLIWMEAGQEKAVEFNIDRTDGYTGPLTVTGADSEVLKVVPLEAPAGATTTTVSVAVAPAARPMAYPFRIAFASLDGGASHAVPITVHVLPVAGVRSLVGHTGSVTCVTLSPDSQLGLSGGADGTVRLWDVATGEEKWKVAAHAGTVQDVAFEADGKRAMSGGADHGVRLYDVASGKDTLCKNVYDGKAIHDSEVWLVRFVDGVPTSRSAAKLVRWENDGQVRTKVIRDKLMGVVQKRTPDTSAVLPRRGNTQVPADYGDFSLSGVGTRAATVWKRDQKVSQIPTQGGANVRLLVAAGDGRRVLTVGDDNLVRLWDTTAASAKPVPGFPWKPGYEVTCAALDGRGGQMLLGGPDGTLKLWRLP